MRVEEGMQAWLGGRASGGGMIAVSSGIATGVS